jgi:hypothetical protein
MSNYNSLKNKVTQIPKVTTRSMFGYQCYSISGKVFVGFNNKNDWQVIVRLPKDEQQIAIRTKGIKPFLMGERAGLLHTLMTIQMTTS